MSKPLPRTFNLPRALSRLVAAYALNLLGATGILAQAPADTTATPPARTITLAGYADAYYARYNSDQAADVLQPYATAGPRDNTFGLNVVEVGVHYAGPRTRANVVLHGGDIPRATWSRDFEMIQEANAGVQLAEGVWLDAGFFRTHVGTESFLPKNNLLSQTAYVTFNEPFYQAGARLAVERFEGWTLEVWGLNGYNSFVDNNSAKSIGLLVSRELNDATVLSYSNLLGRESADGAPEKQLRFYQNAYLNTAFGKWDLTFGADLGIQTRTPELVGGSVEDEVARLFAALATARYSFNEQWSATGRGEVFNDNRGFISGVTEDVTGLTSGAELAAVTLGGEYAPTEGSYLRVEGRYTRTTNGLLLFPMGDGFGREQVALLLTLGVDVSRVFAM